MAIGGGGTTPAATEERIGRRRRQRQRGAAAGTTTTLLILRSVAAAVLLALFTGLHVFYALCATGAVFAGASPSPAGGVVAWNRKVGPGPSAWALALLCLVADVVVVSGLVVERFRVGNGKASAVAVTPAAAAEYAVPAPMDMC